MIELTNAHLAALIVIRGGCLCHILAPCWRCTDAPTEMELAALGIDAPAPARKAMPELPPEVWNSTPVSADRAMAAVRSMCGSASTWFLLRVAIACTLGDLALVWLAARVLA